MSLRILSFTGHSSRLTLRPNGAIRRTNLNTRARTDAPSLTISGGSWRANAQKWPSREALFTERKNLFPVCNKTQTPGECQGAARLFNTSSSSESVITWVRSAGWTTLNCFQCSGLALRFVFCFFFSQQQVDQEWRRHA